MAELSSEAQAKNCSFDFDDGEQAPRCGSGRQSYAAATAGAATVRTDPAYRLPDAPRSGGEKGWIAGELPADDRVQHRHCLVQKNMNGNIMTRLKSQGLKLKVR